ncbi:unnamed protein product [Aureobasidium pullulans]|nr:unnamed protein product [Aureobasidium pullulans]
MAPKTKVPAGPLHKNLTQDDLVIFRTNLVKTLEMTSVIETAFQQLNVKLQALRVTGPVATAIDPDIVDSAMMSARAQEETSATFVQEGRIGETLTAVNEGLAAIGGMTPSILKIRDRLNELIDTTKSGGTVVTDGLQTLGFHKDIEAWDASVNEWAALTIVTTWKVSELPLRDDASHQQE